MQHITPGPDGNAVIHDGSTTITAQEQPNGQVKITVDDGSGQPTTYTLGQQDATTGAATGTLQPGATDPSGLQQPLYNPTTGPAGAPYQTPDLTSQQQPVPTTTSGTDYSGSSTYAPQPSYDPSTMAQPSTSDMSVPVAANQMTTPASMLSDPGLGGAVGGGGGVPDASSFAQGFGGGMGSAVGGAVGGSHAVADHLMSQHHQAADAFGGTSGHPGVAGTHVTPMGPPGDAQVASAPPGALDQQGQPAQQGGMPMGGMGGMGGGGQGGDQQRGGNHQWRTHGRLFDDAVDDEAIRRFSGTLDDGR